MKVRATSAADANLHIKAGKCYFQEHSSYENNYTGLHKMNRLKTTKATNSIHSNIANFLDITDVA
jgi:hypothetical protein